MKFVFALTLLLSNFSLIFSQLEIITTNTSEDLYEIDIFNDQTFIVGNNNYFGKVDFQNNNVILKQAPGPDTNVVHSFNRIDSNIVYLVSSYPLFGDDSHLIYSSHDNCETWNLVFDTLNLRINKLVMFDSLEGLFFNSNYKQFRTIDGGVSWTLENNAFLYVEALERYNDSIICIGMFEKFSYSFDRGRTWNNNVFLQLQPTNYIFLSKDTILAACGNTVTKTTNSGLDWTTIDFLENTFFIDIKEKDGIVYSVGKISYFDEFGIETIRGIIAVSSNSGQNWDYYNTNLETWFQSIEFLNDSIALISGTNGVLIKYHYRDHHLGFQELGHLGLKINLYPNPANDQQELTISANKYEKIEIYLCELNGKKLKTVFIGSVDTGTTKIIIDTSDLNSGMYFYSIESQEKREVLKFVKK
jgi:hypothetical protein